MKLCFGDIVVVNETQIGVVVKCWEGSLQGKPSSYDVYVRSHNAIGNYPENKIERYMVRHKYLNEEELEYQKQCVGSDRADVIPVRHGTWKKRGNSRCCSECGFIYYSGNGAFNFCPSCGDVKNMKVTEKNDKQVN